MHTLRELILGAFLSKNGFCVRSDFRTESTTPDWCILNDRGDPQCIVELVNFHADAQTSADIVRQIEEKGIWCSFVRPNTERLYYAIWDKASKYKDVAAKNKLGYIVSVFGEFDANVEEEELDECLLDKETGLFKLYPEVSGVLFFEESGGSYLFSYNANEYANRTMNIRGGWFYKNHSGA
jgi:hypothetical protein